MVVMAWNVTLDPLSPKWSILVKQICAVATAVALAAFVPLRICCYLAACGAGWGGVGRSGVGWGGVGWSSVHRQCESVKTLTPSTVSDFKKFQVYIAMLEW